MKYYLLEQDLRIPDIAAVGELPEAIDPYEWMSGKKMPAPEGNPLRVMLTRGSGSYRGGIIGASLTLFSDQLKEALSKLNIDNIDYYPVLLENPDSGAVEAGYWLANVIDLVACVDVAKSVIVERPSGGKGSLESFTVDPEKAKGNRLFRLAENPTLIVIDQDLRQSLEDMKIGGVRMRATEKYEGY